MENRLKRKAYTIIEMMMVLLIMIALAFIALPASKALSRSFTSEGIVLAQVNAALSHARSLAISEGTYAGVRFQRDKSGRQYMVFVRFNGDVEGIHDSRKYSFRPVDGMKPIAVPEGYFLLDFKIRADYDDEENYESADFPVVPAEEFLRDTTTFSICFDRTGKLSMTNMRIFADYDADGVSTDTLFNDWDYYITGDANQSDTLESYETVLLCADVNAGEGLGGEQSRISVRIANQNDYDNYEALKYFYFSALPQYHAGIWTGKLMQN